MTPLLTASVLAAAGVGATLTLRPSPRGRTTRRGHDVLARLGSLVGTRASSRLPSIVGVDDRLIGAACVLSAGLVLAIPPLAMAPPVAIGGLAVVRERARRVAHQRSIERGMVQLVDLLALAVAAGLPLPTAFDVAAARLPPAHAELVGSLLARIGQGEPVGAALRWYGAHLGAAGADLAAVLIASARDGAPLVAGLERAADATRRAERRALERRARRLPVTMLLPLVLCVLPAFVVLTLVPLLVGTLSDLRLPG